MAITITRAKIEEDELYLIGVSKKQNVSINEFYQLKFNKEKYLFKVVAVETEGTELVVKLIEKTPWAMRLTRYMSVDLRNVIGEKLTKMPENQLIT